VTTDSIVSQLLSSRTPTQTRAFLVLTATRALARSRASLREPPAEMWMALEAADRFVRGSAVQRELDGWRDAAASKVDKRDKVSVALGAIVDRVCGPDVCAVARAVSRDAAGLAGYFAMQGAECAFAAARAIDAAREDEWDLQAADLRHVGGSRE